ncbi:hypothetical protein FACS1894208_06660 [Clostridia bacterium]|nr:hypothetical protein FACS1894208_06660 [Clostridia bacterium]
MATMTLEREPFAFAFAGFEELSSDELQNVDGGAIDPLSFFLGSLTSVVGNYMTRALDAMIANVTGNLPAQVRALNPYSSVWVM